MTGLVVTKQQFLDAMAKVGWEFNDPDADVFEDLAKVGFVLLDKETLQKLKSDLEEERKGFKKFTAAYDYREGKIVLLEEILGVK